MSIDVAADMVGAITCCHVVTYACECVCVCVRMCTCVCVSVISGLNIIFKIYANPLNTLHLYTCRFVFILSYGTIFLFIFTHVMWRDEKSPILIFNRSRRFHLIRRVLSNI